MERYRGDLMVTCCLVLATGLVPPVTPAKYDTLRVTQVVFRHGDRAPLMTFPTDPNQEDAWPQGFGQLTMKGIAQEYKLGERLREHYNGWLNDTYINKEILVTSTGYDRTLVSAEAVLAGLFPPVTAQQWNPDLNWQPIPVHTRPLEDDHVLYMDLPCDRYMELAIKTYTSASMISYLRENQEFFHYIAEQAGLSDEKKNFVDLTDYISGPLICEKENGLPLADWVTDEVYEKIKEMALVKTQLWYILPEQQQLKAGRWVFEALAIMKNITQDTGLYTQKVFLYSAHESTITAFQQSLGVWDFQVPPYSCFFMLELHEPQPDSYTVRIFYKNDTNADYEAEPKELFFPDCPDPCSLEDFEKMVGPYLVGSDDELAVLCATTQRKKNTNIQETTLALIIIVVFVFVITVTIGVICCRKRQRNPYEKL